MKKEQFQPIRKSIRPATLALLGGPAPPPRRSADNPAALPSRRAFSLGVQRPRRRSGRRAPAAPTRPRGWPGSASTSLTVAGEQPHAGGIAAHHQPIAVV